MNTSLGKHVIKAASAAVVLGSTFLFAASARAVDTGLGTTAQKAGLSGGETDLPRLIGSFIGALLGLLGVVFVLLTIYAGFLWMTAQGNEEKVKKAKSTISAAVIGLVIILASYAITNFVISSLETSLSGAGTPAEETPPAE